jgi:hypothetical protein
VGETPDTIVAWAEAHSRVKVPAPNAGASHLTPEDIADVLFYDRKGLTQEQIAAKFDPPKHQSTISRCLTEWGLDRTAEAKRMVKAASPRMVKDIVESSDMKTKAVLLKGGGVLVDQQAQGIVVHVGRGGLVNLGSLSPLVTRELVE